VALSEVVAEAVGKRVVAARHRVAAVVEDPAEGARQAVDNPVVDNQVVAAQRVAVADLAVVHHLPVADHLEEAQELSVADHLAVVADSPVVVDRRVVEPAQQALLRQRLLFRPVFTAQARQLKST